MDGLYCNHQDTSPGRMLAGQHAVWLFLGKQELTSVCPLQIGHWAQTKEMIPQNQ